MKTRTGWAVGALVLLIAAAGLWAWTDYRAWLALGPGGLPYNFGGWMTTTRRAWFEAKDGLGTGRYDPRLGDPQQCGHLAGLAPREGPRPKVGHWPVPHRQLDQLPSDDQKRQGEAMIQGMASSAPGRFEIKKSVFEKRNDALFVRAAGAGDGAMTKGEVGHMHPSDGSLHVIVGAVDARALIKAGWGQAHPLAGLDNRPDGYLMIYAPRTPAELAVAKGILEAAAGHIGGSPCAPGG